MEIRRRNVCWFVSNNFRQFLILKLIPDIDECNETSSFCDPFAKCVNTNGSYYCECPINYHLFNASNFNPSQWGSIQRYLIDGYSCVGPFRCLNSLLLLKIIDYRNNLHL